MPSRRPPRASRSGSESSSDIAWSTTIPAGSSRPLGVELEPPRDLGDRGARQQR